MSIPSYDHLAKQLGRRAMNLALHHNQPYVDLAEKIIDAIALYILTTMRESHLPGHQLLWELEQALPLVRAYAALLEAELLPEAECLYCFHRQPYRPDDWTKIPNLSEKAQPGDRLPAAECPTCQHLMYPAEEPDHD